MKIVLLSIKCVSNFNVFILNFDTFVLKLKHFVYLHSVWDESPSVSIMGIFPETSRFFLFKMVYFCYIDESGTPQIPGNTSHYVLVGLSIPVSKWRFCEKEISELKKRYSLENTEIHTGWMLRKYIEQQRIRDFDNMPYDQRKRHVEIERRKEIYRLKKAKASKQLKQTKKNFKKTEPYVHLTYNERLNFIQELADLIGSWKFARLFGVVIDKTFFDPQRSRLSVDEQAFEQLVSRFEQYLQIISKSSRNNEIYGTLIHDNNDTVSFRHTQLMKNFHRKGTFWISIEKIIETPFFVNSELTSMVQLADLCGYAIRRYYENNETNLFDRIKSRIDRKNGKIVGIRHFTNSECNCEICRNR